MKFTFYWLDGKREVLEGKSPVDALNNAGYGQGVIAALDFYANGDDSEYEFVRHNHTWEKKK